MSNIEQKLYQFPGGLRLAKDGSWHHGGTPVTHERIISYLNRHLAWSAAAGSWGIPAGEWFIPIEVDDAPFIVIAVDLDAAPLLHLSDESSQPFVVEELYFGEDDVPYTAIKNQTAEGGTAAARFSRSAMQSLISRIEEQDGRFFLLTGSGSSSKRTEIEAGKRKRL